METTEHRKKKWLIHYFRCILVAPLIWGMLLPLAFLDFFMELYQHICFPLCDIPIVKRSKYFKFERTKLPYLSLIQKLNCFFCSYANGVLLYASAIAASTEKYWCPIRNRRNNDYIEPKHHQHFFEYGEEKSFKEYLDGFDKE